MPQKKHKPEEIVAKLRQVDPPLKKWTGLGRFTLHLGWAEIAEG